MKCICHSLHLCCSEACKSLPQRCEDWAHNIFNFFAHSSKRQSELVEFQNFLNISVHKILHSSQTRWLFLFTVVQRILEQWDSLKFYFSKKWLALKLVSAENIYFKYFQTEEVVLNTLNAKIILVYKELLLCYMKRDYVLQSSLANLNSADESKFMHPSAVYVGIKVLNHIKTPTTTLRKILC